MTDQKETFEKYELPKPGIFTSVSNKYTEKRWNGPEVEALIIGEAQLSYIYEVRRFHPDFNCAGYGKPEPTNTDIDEIVYIGFHKSRLVKWKDE